MDNRTLAVVVVIISLIISLVYLAFAMVRSPLRGRWLWFSGFMGVTLGVALVTTQGILPELWSVFAANALILYGFLTVTLGLRDFFGLRVLQWWHGAMALLYLLGFVAFLWVWPSVPLRFIAFSAIMIMPSVEAGLVLWSRRALIHRAVTWLTLGVAAFIVTLNVTRMVLALVEGATSVFAPNLGSMIFLLGSVIVVVAWGLSFILVHFSRTSRELETAVTELASSNQAKDTLLSMVAHDLRGPLGNMQMIGQLSGRLAGDQGCVDPEEYALSARAMEASAESALGILSNLMHWAEAKRGILGKNLQDDDLRAPVWSVLAQLKPQARQKGVELQGIIPPAPVTALFDDPAVELIVRNLVSNAVKFSPVGSVVRVSVHPEDARVEVRDEGAGMDKAQLEKLFVPDRKKVRQGTALEVGTGLGLVLVHELAQAGKIRIHVDSAPGQGTLFTLDFPR